MNFTLLNWEVWKVVNNISQKPKNTFKWHYWWWYMCVCVCVCVCSDWVALFKICPIQGFNVSGLQVTKSRSKGFWNERVTVKKLQDRPIRCPNTVPIRGCGWQDQTGTAERVAADLKGWLGAVPRVHSDGSNLKSRFWGQTYLSIFQIKAVNTIASIYYHNFIKYIWHQS